MELLHRANCVTGQTGGRANSGQGKQWAGQIRAGQTGARANGGWAKMCATEGTGPWKLKELYPDFSPTLPDLV